MSWTDRMKSIREQKKDRLISIDEIPFATAEITLRPSGATREQKVVVGGKRSNESNTYYLKPNFIDHGDTDHAYKFPFLLEQDERTPFGYGNLFLWSYVTGETRTAFINTDALRRKASNLLDYKMYVERSGSHLLDFDARRPLGRITYKYFEYLLGSGLSNATINLKTLVVFEFYTWLCRQPDITLDIDRVDSTKKAFAMLQGKNGTYAKEYTKRSQTLLTPPSAPVQKGYVRDEGEDLRPLSKNDESLLWNEVSTDRYSLTSRLIVETALDTGARKQTILTLRRKHLDLFTEENLLSDGTYRLACGPGTGIDTKNNKRIFIYVPKPLAEKLVLYSNSQASSDRREKFMSQLTHYMDEKDVYVFLSNQGNCYYMAKDDPRWRKQGRSCKGAAIQNIVDKIKDALVSKGFPKDFTFHWLRATFALRYFEHLEPQVQAGTLSLTEQISKVQKRLSHSNRETTEGYLKLAQNIDEVLSAQERYEERLYGGIDSRTLSSYQ
jgi:integrase